MATDQQLTPEQIQTSAEAIFHKCLMPSQNDAVVIVNSATAAGVKALQGAGILQPTILAEAGGADYESVALVSPGWRPTASLSVPELLKKAKRALSSYLNN